jgi:hypothetical protein
MEDASNATAQFMQLTGVQDASVANEMLSAANGDLERAIALHFDAAAADDGGEEEQAAEGEAPGTSDEPAAPSLPGDRSGDLVGAILGNAKKEEATESSAFAGAGRTLGASPPPDEPPTAAAAAAPADRHNAKKVRIIFWADGFTVEDVTADEEKAAAAAAAAKNAPRKTGVTGLGSMREQQPQTMPNIPDLRSYEENKEFMEDLKQGIPPVEVWLAAPSPPFPGVRAQ